MYHLLTTHKIWREEYLNGHFTYFQVHSGHGRSVAPLCAISFYDEVLCRFSSAPLPQRVCADASVAYQQLDQLKSCHGYFNGFDS